MNILHLIQRKQQKQQALKAAQAITAKTFCYRGVCYTR